MSNINDEDEATIVLDFNEIKNQLSHEDDDSLMDTSDLDFAVKIDDAPKNLTVLKSLIAFDYQINFFEKKFQSPEIKIISELKELNAILRSSQNNIITFYYNSAPKVINQLILQIKAKFPNNKIIIVASKLSDEKAQIHKSSKFGVDAYMKDNFKLNDFIEKIKSL